MKSNRNFSVVKVFVLALLAGGLFSGLASAQDVIQGTFTLPCETRWGAAVLPAGDYSFSLHSIGPPSLVTVRKAAKNTGVAMIMARGTNSHRPSDDPSALFLVRHGEKGVVRSMYLAEIGLTLDYSTRETQERFLAQGPELIQRVSISTGGAAGK